MIEVSIINMFFVLNINMREVQLLQTTIRFRQIYLKDHHMSYAKTLGLPPCRHDVQIVSHI